MLKLDRARRRGDRALPREKLPLLDGIDTRVVVSIGATPRGLRAPGRAADAVPRCDVIELNISCPNVKEGGLDMSTTPRLAGSRAPVRGATGKPVWASSPPNVTSIASVGRRASRRAPTALRDQHPSRHEGGRAHPPARAATGGGRPERPAIRPVALAKCWDWCASGLRRDRIGGIATAEDALES